MSIAEQFAQAEMVTTETMANDANAVIERIQMKDLTEAELEQLPFGAIQLDTAGRILRYNGFESKLSGIHRNRALGKHFFTELAPCTNVKEFYGRFQEGVARKRMHEKFRYHFSFKKNPIDVTITLFYSDLTDSIWVFARPV
ncbi:MAG TPA: PAS domain-containing protein [Terriglobales bacterium]|jgi:photoactive yellow protein|nr:PAS domain-containing protein [Terriglobales bacterium]